MGASEQVRVEVGRTAAPYAHRVEAVGDVAEARAFLRRHLPGLVVLDLQGAPDAGAG